MGRKPKVSVAGEVARHPPSRELWRFCLAVLRSVRGPDENGRVLTTIAGISTAYLNRWRQGQMYMDRAEHLVRLAAALEVDLKILIDLACGTIDTAKALRIHSGASELADTRAQAGLAGADLLGEYGFDSSTGGVPRTPGRRRLVLVISAMHSYRDPLIAALQQSEHVTGLVADNLSLGLVVAERYRPHITFLDLAVSPSFALDACRMLSRLGCGARQRNRVVAGAVAITEVTTTSALMAGAVAVLPVPFQKAGFLAELERLPRLAASKKRRTRKDAPDSSESAPATTNASI